MTVLLLEKMDQPIPVEHIPSLRAMPNLTVMRPADANETIQAYRFAIEQKDSPVAMVLTRQKFRYSRVQRKRLVRELPKGPTC